MTLKQIIQASSLPQLEVELLLSFILKKPREFIIIHPEFAINKLQEKKFLSLEDRRLNNFPIAYLMGHKEFYGLNFKVNKNVLVPRPETEMLVDIILEYANSKPEKLDFIDIGTGSGVIIISLAKTCKQKCPSKYQKSSFTALDISTSALSVAKYNSKQQGLNTKIEFIKSDLLNSLKSKKLTGKNLIIAANLPYLTVQQIKSEPSISQEPKLALEAGYDGLKYYRRLLRDLKPIKFASLFLILEIDPRQAQKIKELIKKQWLKSKPKIIKDLSKNNRFALVEIEQ